MPLEFKRNIALLREVVSIEEAETLLEWLQKKANPKVDLAGCHHLHPANLQILLAAHVTVIAWPADAVFAGWLQSVLKS